MITRGEAKCFLPYLLRSCGDDLFQEGLGPPDIFDAVSPYGYPGFLLNDAAASDVWFLNAAIDRLLAEFRSRNICSAFLRLHPILNAGLKFVQSPRISIRTSETVSIDLQLSEAEMWQQTRSEHRTAINKIKRAGFATNFVGFSKNIDLFKEVYEQTMQRVGASSQYFFSEEYFRRLSAATGDMLHLCLVEMDGEVACVGLFSECCNIVQYHLGGTRSEFMKFGPTKLMFHAVRNWARERGNEILHLGGGLGGAEDSLYHFKAGFSKRRDMFATMALVPDQEKYSHLTSLGPSPLASKRIS